MGRLTKAQTDRAMELIQIIHRDGCIPPRNEVQELPGILSSDDPMYARYKDIYSGPVIELKVLLSKLDLRARVRFIALNSSFALGGKLSKYLCDSSAQAINYHKKIGV